MQQVLTLPPHSQLAMNSPSLSSQVLMCHCEGFTVRYQMITRAELEQRLAHDASSSCGDSRRDAPSPPPLTTLKSRQVAIAADRGYYDELCHELFDWAGVSPSDMISPHISLNLGPLIHSCPPSPPSHSQALWAQARRSRRVRRAPPTSSPQVRSTSHLPRISLASPA